MNSLILFGTLVLCIVVTNAATIGYGTPSSVSNSQAGAAVDEVVVESSLYIKKKPQIRRVREVSLVVPVEITRVKRQHRHRGPNPQYGFDQSQAQAAANSNSFGPQGFGAAAALAGAQGFQSRGPLGGFGASATNSATQALSGGPGGLQGSAGFSGAQHYDFGNKKIDVTYGNSFAAGPGGVSRGGANNVVISK